jgi:hypothetical protein
MELGWRHAVIRVSLFVLVQRAADSRTSQNSLDELILPQRLGKVIIHLSRETLLAVANHGVGSEGDDRG